MNDEIFFTCEICHQNFPATADAMLECSADFRAIDSETGEIVDVDDELHQRIIEEARKDPTIGPFLKGAICVCEKCQQEFASDSEDQI
jgi:hypothetical protein